MNENARKWVAALRSGRYSQANGSLKNGDSFCCLGVACDLYAESHPTSGWDGNDVFYFDEAGHRKNFEDVLPRPVVRYLGLTDDWGAFTDYCPMIDGASSLTELNDGGASFDEIADWIESEPEGLFVKDS